ncbi:MAG: sensor histidine kinase [Eubacterium sp.]|nr:sensor histidine kinase [Eubacterium sp.]
MTDRKRWNLICILFDLTLLTAGIRSGIHLFWILCVIRLTADMMALWYDSEGSNPSISDVTETDDPVMAAQLFPDDDSDLEKNLLNRQVEFQNLQSQINPHFLYNTLESIRGQALIDGAPEIANMTKALSAYFRYSVSTSADLVRLEDELRNIRNYFVIQQYRFGSKLTMDITFEDPEAICNDILLPKLTLQPILENAIFHGLEPGTKPGHLQITVTTTQSRLLIMVSDNGVGIDSETLAALNDKLEHGGIEADSHSASKHSGIALINVNKRIQLCFGQAYGLHVRSIPDIGTDVEIITPIVRKTEPGKDRIF